MEEVLTSDQHITPLPAAPTLDGTVDILVVFTSNLGPQNLMKIDIAYLE